MGSDVPLLAVDELGQRPDLTTVVFGKLLGKKAVALAQAGVRSLVFGRNPAFNRTKRYDPDFYDKYAAPLEALFERLEDDESRLVLASIVRSRITGDHGYCRISAYPEYDHPIVHPDVGDHVLDLGMGTADTALWFADRVGTEGVVFGFEGDPENWAPIEQQLHEGRAMNVHLVKAGVWSHRTRLKFSGGKGTGSRVTKWLGRGSTTVEVVDVDSFCEENEVTKVDLISMDVEGAERKALAGARRTIDGARPKLQLSVYHRIKHLFVIPKQVDELRPGYRFFLGHHTPRGFETDLYAIPS